MRNFDYSMLNLEDMINVEDLTDRIEELEDLRDENEEFEDPDTQKEFEALTALLDELEGMGGDHQWRGEWYPAYLIRYSYFEGYMDETVFDCYDLPKLPSFMTIALDYVALQQDYSSVEVDGVTYWCR